MRLQRGSFVTGTLGAILMVPLAAVPWALLNDSLDWIGIPLGALGAYGIGKGYDWFRGRPGKYKATLIVLCMVLAVFLGNLGASALLVHRSYQANLAPHLEEPYGYLLPTEAELIRLVAEDPEARSQFLRNLRWELIIAAIGTLGVAFDVLKKKQVPEKPKVKASP